MTYYRPMLYIRNPKSHKPNGKNIMPSDMSSLFASNTNRLHSTSRASADKNRPPIFTDFLRLKEMRTFVLLPEFYKLISAIGMKEL